ncbi:MAG: hypothetical protein ACYDD8_05570 [Bradyrhizobium sp.]
MNMKMRHKLITLGLAFGLLGSTCAFAKPAPYFENGRSHEEKAVTGQVPATGISGVTRYARPRSANSVKDDWPSDLILG